MRQCNEQPVCASSVCPNPNRAGIVDLDSVVVDIIAQQIANTLAAGDVKFGTVQEACDDRSYKLSVVERVSGVRAVVVDSMELVTNLEQNNRVAADLDWFGIGRVELVCRCHFHPTTHDRTVSRTRCRMIA